MERISKELKDLALEGSDFSPPKLQVVLKDAIGSLLNPKLKKNAYEIIAKCMQTSPCDAKMLLIKELDHVSKSDTKDESLKIFLAFFDAPSQNKKVVLDEPKFICTFVLDILQKMTSSLFSGKQLGNDESYSLLEENVFIAVKISVLILQNTGYNLLEKALQDDCHSSWESTWIKAFTSMLLHSIKYEVLQKETLGIIGIALSHIVNAITPAELSCSLASFILQRIVESDKSYSKELKLGPLTIHDIHSEGRTSIISQIATVNGLLTVCSPEILLDRVELHSNENLLVILGAWMDSISRITLKRYHQTRENDALFLSASNVCRNLLELLWDNREDMIEGIPKAVLSIFGKLLNLHNAEKIVLGGEFATDKLMQSITEQLLADPWYIRGKYTLLCELLRHISTSQVLNIDANFPSTLCKCYATSNLVSAANECYKSFITPSKQQSDKRAENWKAEKWKLIFVKDFMSMLADSNTRSTENCVLYFIPTTLNQIPEVFEVMRDAVLAELNKEFSQDEQSVLEWHSRRTSLCYGYCALSKFGRKIGVASFKDIDLNLLHECLDHNDDNLRAEAFSVLCYNNKTTEPISADEQSFILKFIRVNLNCASSSFRQTLFVSMKNLMARLRDSCIMMLRDFKKNQKKGQKMDNSLSIIPDVLSASLDLVDSIASVSLHCLFPGASFQRKKTGLQLLYTVLETFSSPKDAVKKGRTAESLRTLTDWVHSIGKWQFVCERNLVVLMSCFEDQHDEIRELTLDISKWFTFNAFHMTPSSVNEFGRNLMTQATALLNSPRIRDAESGAILFEFLSQRFLSWETRSIFDIQSFDAVCCGSLPDTFSFDGIVHAILSLLQKIELQIRQAYNDILEAAFKQPVFGFIMAARRCFLLLIRHLTFHGKSLVGMENYLTIFIRLVERSVKACKMATEMALSVFFTHEKTKGGSPSFADMNVALENAMKQCKSFKTTEESIGYQHCLELMSSFCWLNIKAATLFLGEIGSVLALDCLRFSEKSEVFPDDLLKEIGIVFRETLVNCRHKGVIENSCVGFQKLCRSVASITSKGKMLYDWLMDTISAVDRNDLNSSVTKRSAGLPMFIQPIVSACFKYPRFQFRALMETLIEIANRPISANTKGQSDLPQVQSMNILKAIFRDSSTGSEVLRYAGDGLMLSINSFTSRSWSIRNAAQILLGALIPRMLGQRITQADKSHHNSLTASKFFKMYPKLLEFFTTVLRSGIHHGEKLLHLPGLIPVLTILSKLRPCNDKDIQSRFYPLLQDLISCPVFTVRKLAASSLVIFMPIKSIAMFIETWTMESKNGDKNFNHGFLLMMRHILEIKLDDMRFADCISVDAFLQISNRVLQSHTQPMQPFVYCTLLEIYEILMPLLYDTSNTENLKYRESVKNGVKEMIDKVNKTDFLRNDPAPGAHLILKRIAHVSLCLIVNEQSIHADFADTLMTCLLSSTNELLVSETAAAITHSLENGRTLTNRLRTTISDLTRRRIILSDDRQESLNFMGCLVNVSNGAQNFEIPLQRAMEYLSDFRTLSLEEMSHGQLAVVLPFLGLIFQQCFKRQSDSHHHFNDTLELMSIWSERILAHSFAHEREILRLSSLKAIQISATSLFQYYEDTLVADQSSREDVVAVVCARFVMALLNFIQDEDELIRNAACDRISDITICHSKEIRCKIQPNFAMTSMFDFVQHKMACNGTLVKYLYQQLDELYDTQVQSLTESRATLLFDQESANLFAEDFIFADMVIQCLEAIQGQGQTVLVKVALPNINCFDGLKERLAIKSKKALHSIHELFDSLADLSYDMCFKIQRIFVAFNLSLGVLRLVMHSPKDQDTETIIKFLSKVKMGKDLHPYLEVEIDRTLTGLQCDL